MLATWGECARFTKSLNALGQLPLATPESSRTLASFAVGTCVAWHHAAATRTFAPAPWKGLRRSKTSNREGNHQQYLQCLRERRLRWRSGAGGKRLVRFSTKPTHSKRVGDRRDFYNAYRNMQATIETRSAWPTTRNIIKASIFSLSQNSHGQSPYKCICIYVYICASTRQI